MTPLAGDTRAWRPAFVVVSLRLSDSETRQRICHQIRRQITQQRGQIAGQRFCDLLRKPHQEFVEKSTAHARAHTSLVADSTCTGTSSAQGFQTGTEAELDALFAVHFKGVFLLSQKLLPLINDGGRIVNLSSALAQRAMANRAIYGSMKAAVETLTKYMAFELAPRRIAVNVVAPGAVATDFSGGMVRDNPEVNKLVASHTALGRAGVPDDIGPMIASLLSEDNRWVNGQRIEVSGGFLG